MSTITSPAPYGKARLSVASSRFGGQSWCDACGGRLIRLCFKVHREFETKGTVKKRCNFLNFIFPISEPCAPPAYLPYFAMLSWPRFVPRYSRPRWFNGPPPFIQDWPVYRKDSCFENYATTRLDFFRQPEKRTGSEQQPKIQPSVVMPNTASKP